MIKLKSDNGNMVPCTGYHMDRYVLGNYVNQSLHEIWHSEKLNALRRKHVAMERMDIEVCADCRHGTIRKDKYLDMEWEEVTREAVVGHSYIYKQDT